jgi:glycosyltransferase involved in cell wall biosynthesis
LNFIDLTYYTLPGSDAAAILDRQEANLGYLAHLPGDFRPAVIKFMEGRNHVRRQGIEHHFFPGSTGKVRWPLEAHRFMGKLQPDVILVHGLLYPLQIIQLRLHLGKRTRIIVQHHAEKPGRGKLLPLQRWASRYVSAYLFHSREQARPWLELGVIPSPSVVHEVTEGSSPFVPLDRWQARQATGMCGGPAFLWVGRLNANKDPLTVLRGFSSYARENEHAKLYMIYGEDTLLPQVRSLLEELHLQDQVVLVGKVAHKELDAWLSGADFFLSGSHYEGSGYALIEAMSCGCIPVVTDIPSFRKITAGGQCGFHFRSGDPLSLANVLATLPEPTAEWKDKVVRHFREHLSFERIAKDLAEVCRAVSR